MLIWIKPRLWRMLTVFVIGMLLGGAVITVRIGATVDNLSIKNSDLTQQLDATQSELEEVKKNLASERRQVITSVEVELVLRGEDLGRFSEEPLKLELEKEIMQLLKPVVGQDVKSLNFPLLPQLLEGRIVTVDNHSFVLHVKTIILTDRLIAHVQAEPPQTSD